MTDQHLCHCHQWRLDECPNTQVAVLARLEMQMTDPTNSRAMEEADKIVRGLPYVDFGHSTKLEARLRESIARALSEQNDLILKREAECRAVEAQLLERERDVTALKALWMEQRDNNAKLLTRLEERIAELGTELWERNQ